MCMYKFPYRLLTRDGYNWSIIPNWSISEIFEQVNLLIAMYLRSHGVEKSFEWTAPHQPQTPPLINWLIVQSLTFLQIIMFPLSLKYRNSRVLIFNHTFCIFFTIDMYFCNNKLFKLPISIQWTIQWTWVFWITYESNFFPKSSVKFKLFLIM